VEDQQLRLTEELVALAYEQRADLMAKQAKLSESLFNQNKVYASYGPKVSLGGRGGPNYAFHEKEHGALYQISLNFEMPLFNGFEGVYQHRIAYADTQLSLEDLSELQLDIILEVLTHNRTLQAVQEMLPEAEENLNSALKAYESTLQRYQAGIERIAEVSNAQRQLATARVRHSEVKTRWFTSMANLAYATGTLRP
jgi:outer membrane protein TolC